MNNVYLYKNNIAPTLISVVIANTSVVIANTLHESYWISKSILDDVYVHVIVLKSKRYV